MSLNIEKAFDRIQWQLFTNKGLANKADKEAMKFLADWINKQQEERIREQQLFAKLWVHVFTNELNYCKDLKFAVQHMDFTCSLPLSHYTDIFNFHFNVIKYQVFCESKGIPHEMPDKFTEEEKELVLEHIQSDKDFLKHIRGFWSKEKTEESLTKQILEAITKHGNSI